MAIESRINSKPLATPADPGRGFFVRSRAGERPGLAYLDPSLVRVILRVRPLKIISCQGENFMVGVVVSTT